MLSEDTARLYGLYPRKGSLEPGADADFTLVNPAGTTIVDAARLHSKEPQTPWQGRRLRGAVAATILRGEVIARHGEVVGEPRGRLVRAKHGSPPSPRGRGGSPSRGSSSGGAPLAFTQELDQVITPETVPATVFEVGDG